MAKVTTSHKKYKGVIVSRFNLAKLRAGLQAQRKDIINNLTKRLSYIGEECVRIARGSGSYNDITGNLRSSIGYVVLYDGKPVVGGKFIATTVQAGTRKVKRPDGSWQTIKVGGDGSAGQKAGQDLLKKLQSEYPWGLVLIVCAGMKYAAYVEAVRHKDVLTSAELRAESLAKQLLNGFITEK